MQHGKLLLSARGLVLHHMRALEALQTGLRDALQASPGDRRAYSSGDGRRRDSSRPVAVDTSHRSATEQVWPATRQQQKFAARVYTALTSVLAAEEVFRAALVQQFGFSIKAVRMSPDHAKAFVLWGSWNGRAEAAGQELHRRGPKLRASVARVLGARNVPRLEFRHDRLSAEDDALERAFALMEEERRGEEEQAERRGGGGGEVGTAREDRLWEVQQQQQGADHGAIGSGSEEEEELHADGNSAGRM